MRTQALGGAAGRDIADQQSTGSGGVIKVAESNVVGYDTHNSNI